MVIYGLASILGGLLALGGFVACVARADARRTDLSPAGEPATGRPALGWLAVCVLLIAGGVGLLLIQVVQTWQ